MVFSLTQTVVSDILQDSDLSVMAKSKYCILCEISPASLQFLHFRHYCLLISTATYTPLSAAQ